MRADHSLIKSMFQSFGVDRVNEYLSIPFFEIASSEKMMRLIRNVLNDFGGKYEVADIMGIIPFNQFTVWYENDSTIGTFGFDKVSDDKIAITMTNYVDSETSNMLNVPKGECLTVVSEYTNATGFKALEFVIGDKRSDAKSLDVSTKLNTTSEEALKSVLDYFAAVESNDMYMVERKKQTTNRDTKSAVKKPWTRNDLPSVVYMNVLPSERKEHQGGTHASPMGHHRRGHWRKLTHPKYKNHPKFGSRIRIKQVWVGPTETVVNGTIYKVKTVGD